MPKVDIKLKQTELKKVSITEIFPTKKMDNTLIEGIDVVGNTLMNCNLSLKDREKIRFKNVIAPSGLTHRIMGFGEKNGIFAASSVFVFGMFMFFEREDIFIKIEENNFRIIFLGSLTRNYFYIMFKFKHPTTIELTQFLGSPLQTYSSRVISVT